MALDLFNEFATNPEAERKGIWEAFDADVSFLIARAHNPGYNRVITGLAKKHKALLDSKSEAAQAKSDELMAETMSRTILLGWKGEFNFKGEPMGEYTVDKALKLLMVKDFRTWVANISEDHARFKMVQDEEAAGN